MSLMQPENLPAFLTCYDYGTGGVWLLLEAPSHQAAQLAYPEFTVFENRPDWMTEAEEREFRIDCDRIGYRWNINKPSTGWLRDFFDRKS